MKPIRETNKPLSEELIHQSELDTSTPLIIRGGLSQLAASKKWSDLDYLKRTAGADSVSVRQKVQSDNYLTKFMLDRKEMSLKQFVENFDDSEKFEYIGNTSVPENLENDLEPLPTVLTNQFRKPQFWFGKSGYTGPIHYDWWGDTLLGNIVGTKTLKLYAPSESNKLYPNPLGTGVSIFSQVNPNEPDEFIHSAFRKAEYYSGEIGAGDLVLIPLYWWHQIGISSGEWTISLSYGKKKAIALERSCKEKDLESSFDYFIRNTMKSFLPETVRASWFKISQGAKSRLMESFLSKLYETQPSVFQISKVLAIIESYVNNERQIIS